jgi:Fe-S-cluster containining protein
MTLKQKTVYENTDISLFHVDDAWDVTFVYDSQNSYVELEYSAYLEEYVSVWDTNGWLNIGFKGSVYKQPESVFKAKVHTSEREHLYIMADDASVITMEGLFELEDMNIDLRNASICNGFEVTSQSCGIQLTYGSQLYGVNFNGTNCSVYAHKESSCKGYFNVEQSFTTGVGISSQLIVFGGSMSSASIEVKDAGTINMVQAEVKDMHVYLDGASEATVNVTETLSGFLLSGSTLYYKGHPQIDVDCSEDSTLQPI